jgi:hypothetical protein
MADAKSSGAPRKRGRPATSPEEREKELQNKAYDLAEEQLDNGKASSQLITLLIKGGGAQGALELEKLRNENRLLNARIDSLKAAESIQASIEEALVAFKTYTGDFGDDPDD